MASPIASDVPRITHDLEALSRGCPATFPFLLPGSLPTRRHTHSTLG